MRQGRAAKPGEDPLASLAKGARERRPQAARAFLVAVAPLVLRTVRQILGRDHPDVEDIVQEALLSTLEALPRFRGDCSTAHFVRRVGLLTALNARRRFLLRQQIVPLASRTDTDSLPSRGKSPADEVEAERRRSLFTALLDELPAPQAEAIGLHCVLGYTVAETAAVAGVPINTVRGRLVAAKAVLRQRLEQDTTVYELFKGVS
jgi:RNA polymerase sigma factor (sigma-70 family)